MARVPLPAALFVIYALVLAAVLLAFRGTSRSVGVSLRRAEQAMRETPDDAAAASRASSSLGSLATTSVPPGVIAAGGAPHESDSALLPPLDAALQGGSGEGALPEDDRPGFGADQGAFGPDAWLEEEPGEIEPASIHEPPRISSQARSGRSLFGDLDRALQLPSVRKTPPRERFELEARKMAEIRSRTIPLAGSANSFAEREHGFVQGSGVGPASQAPPRSELHRQTPSRAPSLRSELHHHQANRFSPEARLMLPSSFTSGSSEGARPTREAKTIYPSEDATYGAAEFDVVVSPQQQEKASRFSMTPEERILATHIQGG